MEPQTITSPLQRVPGEGKNMKHVKNCTELYMGSLGLEHLSGFHSLVNLEVLWINNNRLKFITNLGKNFRIKVLYAQDNAICSLKGSLRYFKFLEVLDLSRNELRDLDKMICHLKSFSFLTHLNLQGNPCCEEPDYRLLVIHELPSVRVLDHHVITNQERRRAQEIIGGGIQSSLIVFGKRSLPYDPRFNEKVPIFSKLEQGVYEECARIRSAKGHSGDQDVDCSPSCASNFPPPPGWTEAIRKSVFGSEIKKLSFPKDGVQFRQSSSCPVTARGEEGARDIFTHWNCRSKPSKEVPAMRDSGSIKLSVGAYNRFLEKKRAAESWVLTRNTAVL
ncbi:hypothetical protein BSKO_13083 [Bryopsis sp. KO-2023]|nr:hypothetical protein BSKO_13083 [Bryopsis sp. KO-2023]